MPWLMAKIYDGFMSGPETACLGGWRRELLTGVTGRVLEVGAGTGANLPHYPEGSVDLTLTEPDPHMAELLAPRAAARGARVLPDALGSLSLPDASVDTVVCTLVLCTVDHPDAALADLRRVLRPGGRLIFLEHVAAESGTSRRIWQGRLEPLWKRIAGGCCVTRDTEAAIGRAGFEVEQITRESMRRAPPWVRPTIRGVARVA